MTRFLIEVPHEDKKEACEQAIQTFLTTGSHFMTHADWGCGDDEHKAWLVVELESREEAKAILPPLYRRNAKIVALKRYTMEDMEEDVKKHGQ